MELNDKKLEVINQVIDKFNDLLIHSDDVINQSVTNGKGICDLLMHYHGGDIKEINKIYHIDFYYLMAQEHFPKSFLSEGRYWFEKSLNMITARLTMLKFMKDDIQQERFLDNWFNNLSFQDKYKIIQVDYFEEGDETNQSPKEEEEITELFLNNWAVIPVPVKQDYQVAFLNPKYIRKYKWNSNMMFPNTAGAMVKTGGWIQQD